MENVHYLLYGQEEIDYLKSKDPALGEAIEEIGPLKREVIPDLFMALINSIIGQQISTKAQETIWLRFLAAFSPVTPQHINSFTAEQIQACGISMSKALYIKDIAQSIIVGELDLDELQLLSDDEVCRRLSQIKGIGVWTAEMLMIFSMQRMNVLSWNDMAILRGMRMLYRHRKITPKLFSKYRRRYAPYATIASIYLWAISHGACEGLIDRAPKTEAQKKTAAKKRRKGSSI